MGPVIAHDFIIINYFRRMLEAGNIHKRYDKLEILKGVDIHITPGEIVSIVGPSGSGKSTLLHILGTLDEADQGYIEIRGVRISIKGADKIRGMNYLSGNKLAAFRNRHIGFVFQFHHLLPEFTALENVCIPGWIGKRPRKEVVQQANDLLKVMGLANRLGNKPQELSGGEQQRVAVARALINNPSIIMADEPTGNLDSSNARELHRLFIDLRDRFNQTFLIVTHNEELAKMCDRILQMKDGRIN